MNFNIDKFVEQNDETLNEIPTPEVVVQAVEAPVKRGRGRPKGTTTKPPRDPNAPKGVRGRKPGSLNKQTIEGAAKLGLTVEQLKLQATESKLTIAEYLALQAEKVAA